jgi:uncharacterized protein YbjT (DUF2867 family)
MDKVACIFGSTGLIGSYLLNTLKTDGNYKKIIVFNRKKQAAEHPKVEEIVGEYSDLFTFGEQLIADEYYCCLGTTMKKAKTKSAFEYVDYQLPLEIGKIALINKVNYFLIVSSIGASSKSANFYLRTKGKMEEDICKLGIQNVLIFRPSMLLGNRNESRIAESIAKPFSIALGIFLFGPLKKYKAIHGQTVAKAMINSVKSLNGTNFIESDKIKILSR